VGIPINRKIIGFAAGVRRRHGEEFDVPYALIRACARRDQRSDGFGISNSARLRPDQELFSPDIGRVELIIEITGDYCAVPPAKTDKRRTIGAIEASYGIDISANYIFSEIFSQYRFIIWAYIP